MKKLFLLTLLVPLLALAGVAAATAQTPDDIPPALETVCDMENGSAYGLCNAYCEAMDCELANDSDPLTEPSASPNACDKVRDKFIQNTGRDLPCELSCPCNDPAFGLWVDVVSALVAINQCSLIDSVSGTFLNVGYEPSDDLLLVFQPAGTGTTVCGSFAAGNIIPINGEQAQFCTQQLVDAASAQGVTCEQQGG